MVAASHIAMGSEVWVEIYLNRELVWERRMARAVVVERAFFAPSRRLATPPADF
jgi:aminomethyltransferase